MATIAFQRNSGTVSSPTWVDISQSHRIAFTGSATQHNAPLSVGAFNIGTHIVDGLPGNDVCTSGPNNGHNNNNQYVSSGQISINGGSAVALNDTNLAEGACTVRIRLTHDQSVQTQNSFFYAFNGSNHSSPAVNVVAYAFERGVGANQWTKINDYPSVGGNNSGSRLDIGDKSSGTEHLWYLALSATGQQAGTQSQFAFGIVTEIY